MRSLMFILCALLSQGAIAQIQLDAKVSPYKPIIAKASAEIPEGAEVKVRWRGDAGVSIVQVANDAHVWATPGAHTVSASIVWMKFEVVKVGEKELKNLTAWDIINHDQGFIVDGTPPKPDDPVKPDEPDKPEPEPDAIPEDRFDNIGRRAAEWARALSVKARAASPTISGIYTTVGSKYAAGALEDAKAVTTAIAEELNAKLTDPAVRDAWKSNWAPKLNTDLKARWPMVRQDLAEYLLAIGVGLKGVK